MNRHRLLSLTTIAAGLLGAAVVVCAASAEQPQAAEQAAGAAEAPPPQPSPRGRGSEAPSAQPAPAGSESKPSPDQQIARWIGELDSNRYLVRERATRRLLGTGTSALDPLLATANGDRPEPADRAVWILRQLADTDETDARRAALERLVQLKNRPEVVAEAEDALGEIRHALAVEALTKLGGQFLARGSDAPWRQVMADCVLLDDRWRGGDDGLKYLHDLRDVPVVVVIGTDITPAGFAQMQLPDSVQWLQLYGTQLDEADAARLQQAWPGVRVDYRRGALLGVRGDENQVAAVVQSVQPGTAAAEAGIRPLDIIRKFDGQPVANFTALTERIAKHRPGDEVALEIERRGHALEMTVTLGRWKSL